MDSISPGGLLLVGVGFLYLLTLRDEEEGKAGDYIQRLINRIHKLRLKSLSRHLSILNSVASTLTRIVDKLFGSKLLSIQAIGVSVSLALFALNFYYFVDTIRRRDSEWDSLLFDATVFLGFALFPAVLAALTDRPRKYKQRRHQSNSIWFHGWAIVLLVFTLREYVSPIMCTDCLPPQYRQFLFSMMLMVMAVGINPALLFTSFVFLTRLSLKKLSTASSPWKAIGYLLIGCVPAAVFGVLVKAVAFIITHTTFTSASPTDPHSAFHLTAQELFAMSAIVAFGSLFSCKCRLCNCACYLSCYSNTFIS